MSEQSDLRASDADRLAAEEHLRANHLEGRLTVEEFEERVAKAQKAVTIGDLAALQADLPAPAAPARRSAGLVAGEGYQERLELAVPAERAQAYAVGEAIPAMARSGYSLELRGERHVSYVQRRRPGWTIAVAIILFPVGLVALLVRDTVRVTIEIEPAGERRCVVLIRGVAPLPVRQGFAKL